MADNFCPKCGANLSFTKDCSNCGYTPSTSDHYSEHDFAPGWSSTNPCLKCGAWQEEACDVPCVPPKKVTPLPIVILSTTILPLDGVYKVETLDFVPTSMIKESTNYIGHPATKSIVEAMGAIPATTKLFPGLLPEQTAICVSIKQGKSDRSQGGTAVNQEVVLSDLDFRLLTRLE